MQKSKQFFYEKALPVMSAGFDNITEPVYIDKLEIDLGTTNAENFDSDFIKAFRKSLEKYIGSSKTNLATHAEDPASFSIDSLLFFLEKGYWPWNFQQKNEEEIITLVRTFFENEVSVFLLLKQLHAQSSILTERLMQLVTGHAGILSVFIKALQKYHVGLQNALPRLFQGWKQKAYSRESFYFLLLREIIVSLPLADAKQILALLNTLVTQPYALPYLNHDKLKSWQKECTGRAGIESVDLFFSMTKKWQGKRSNQMVDLASFFASTGTAAPVYREKDTVEKINILNGGLILFHPYLLPVFRNLGWLNADKKFVSYNANRRAVLFLQYLVNGKSRHAAHLLVLNKLLCNWPVHLPLKNACNFSSKEKNAAIDLIESLKEHWSILKNTSNRGVIESFVKRAGIVQKTPEGFLLQVQKKTIDILMDTLPFGIGIIKLPWNEHIIYTEW